MLQSLSLSSSSSLILETLDLRGSRKYRISCSSSSRNNRYIPKLEPFSRTRLERAMKDPPLIQRTENELADYCTTLEGDECYNCWKAYFELKDLEKEAPKEDVERLIINSGGMKSLMGYIHGTAEIYRIKKESNSKTEKVSNSEEEVQRVCPIPDGLPKSRKELKEEVQRVCPIPDGLPKSREELEEEESWKMPDSPFTTLLRTMGRTKNPAWYSTPPDH